MVDALNPSQSANQRPGQGASVPGGGRRQAVATGGGAVPPQTLQPAVSPPPGSDASDALRDIGDYIQTVSRSLRISVDDKLGSFVVTVIDSETEEVVRQIPREEFLAVARYIAEQLPAGDTPRPSTT